MVPSDPRLIISLIAARALDYTIGDKGGMPWHYPEDLLRFKGKTRDHAVIMGRKTFESIGKPLPGRKNIVVSRRGFKAPEGVTVVRSIHAAIKAVPRDGTIVEAFIIGGATLYDEYLKHYFVDYAYVTVIGARPNGDTKWRYEFHPDKWDRCSADIIEAHDGASLLFEYYERIAP